MNRSLYSGVSGMKAHQTRMDVIGNNIANVNTYGFKASRVTFSDIYYQTVMAGSEGTSTSGGTNSGGIGYGTSVGSIDLLMGQSSFTMTDSTLDLAIDGEGFLQVQDADGNKYYTRAGAQARSLSTRRATSLTPRATLFSVSTATPSVRPLRATRSFS